MVANNQILSIRDLSIEFRNGKDRSLAVDKISFDLKEGEILGIVGESGSGKSITAMSMLQLLSKSASYPTGEIWFTEGDSSKDILKFSENELLDLRGNKIAMIFQNPMNSLNPSQRCGNQVREAILLHRTKDKKRAKEMVLDLFEKVELPDPERIYSSYPHQLSGGQIQRIMIAMAVSCNPRVLIADEPTTALDVTVQKSILALLKEIKTDYNTSIIFISHDLGVVREIADRVVVMCKGEIVEQGEVDQIFTNPKHPYTQGLIACRPPLSRRLERLPTIEDFMSDEGFDSTTFPEVSSLNYEKRIVELQQNNDLLKVENLKKYYPKSKNFFGKVNEWTKAVDDVSFEMKKGETLGLVGESGSGKSTLGKTILKLIEANAGKVVFDGKDVFGLNSKDLKRLRKDFQIIFQNPYGSLNPRMRIGEAIMEPMEVHKIHDGKSERKQKTIELLETVGLEADHFRRYPHQFSGGQRQRICIARTLSLNPNFIVCDECVSALDVSVQAQILNLLSDLKQKFDLSYIFISHDLSVVKHISDHIMVMQNGKIVEKNNSEELFSNPQQEYTQNLLNSIPR